MGRSSTTRRGPLPQPTVRADDPNLTRFAGVLPFVHFCESLDLPALLSAVVAPVGRVRVHSPARVLFAFLIAAVVGTERLAHLDWFEGDVIMVKLLRLASWPVRQVFSRSLASVPDLGVAALLNINTNLGLRSVRGATHIVLDFDSTAIVCFGEQERAEFGYCGKGRNRRRHYPLVCSVAGSRAVIHAKYRSGEGIDEDEAIAFFKESVDRVRARMPNVIIHIRADAGFWSNKTCTWLLEQKLPFAFSLPLRPAVKLLAWTAEFKPVDDIERVPAEEGEEDEHDDDGVEIAEIAGVALGMDPRLRAIVIRRRLHDKKAPPAGKKVEQDPDHRFQVIITSLDWEPPDVWRFYNDRGDCERVFKTAKQALCLGSLVSHDYRANEVAFLLRLIAYNADILFQQDAEEAAIAENRPVTHMGIKARQSRLYVLAGRLLREHDRWVLRLPASKKVAALWAFYAPARFASG